MGIPNLEDLPHYVWEDYRNWEGRWEIIDGVAYAMSPAPSVRHQEISQKIAQQLGNLLVNCKQCRAILPVDWRIADDIVVQPDNSIVCGFSQKSYLETPPQVIFEILSPSTAKKDKTTKLHLYEKHKVQYYCIIDPDIEIADIYQLTNGKYQILAKGLDPVVTFELDNCKIDFDFSLIWS